MQRFSIWATAFSSLPLVWEPASSPIPWDQDGIRPTSVVGDVVTVGKETYNHNYVQIVQGNPLILRGLKNFGADWNKVSMSFKDIFIYNIPIHQNAESLEGIKGSAFVFDLGTLCIAHLGDLSQKLNPEQIKAFGKVDIALTPIGGYRTMAPDLAREVLGQLKPKIAIPMHYRDNPYLIKEFTAGLQAPDHEDRHLGGQQGRASCFSGNQSSATSRGLQLRVTSEPGSCLRRLDNLSRPYVNRPNPEPDKRAGFRFSGSNSRKVLPFLLHSPRVVSR